MIAKMGIVAETFPLYGAEAFDRVLFKSSLNLYLDLDNNCQSPDGYFGNGVCTPTGMI